MNQKPLLILLAFLSITACAGKEPDELKSPCVSAPSNSAEHPCSDRKPINNWLS